MTLLVVVGKNGDAASDAVARDAARARQLARLVDGLVVVEADQGGESPSDADGRIAPQFPPDSMIDARRSSLSVVLADAAQHEPGTVLLLLDTDARQVERVHPVARKLEVPLLWWRETDPEPGAMAAVEDAIAGLLTWNRPRTTRGWSIGAGIDLASTAIIDTFPHRPPLRLLAWAPSGDREVSALLRGLAFARGLTIDAHLTIVLTPETAADGLRHRVDAHTANLALTRSVHVHVATGISDLPRLLADVHAVVDVEPADGGIPLVPLLAMAHGRPVLSSRDDLAALLTVVPHPLRFRAGDALDLADRMRSLAAAWSNELSDIGQDLRDAVRAEHSVTHWAEAVVSIVGIVRSGGSAPSEPVEQGHPVPDDTSATGDAPDGRFQPDPARRPDPVAADAPNNGDGSGRVDADDADDDPVGGASPRRRWFRRSSGGAAAPAEEGGADTTGPEDTGIEGTGIEGTGIEGAGIEGASPHGTAPEGRSMANGSAETAGPGSGSSAAGSSEAGSPGSGSSETASGA
ncbi:MAG TPA: hypothetical protein VH986_00100 [Acidimicrobiia bacterium]